MTLPTFGCGHAKWGHNAKQVKTRLICRQCHNAYNKAARRRMTPPERYMEHRVRYLPRQIEAARAKLAALEREAARLGMHDLLGPAQ